MEVIGSSPLDIISDLPSSIIQMILTFLPIREAFRTSILSPKWRYHCADIHKLEFNDELLKESGSGSIEKPEENKLFLDIYTVLLLHHGPVIEFSLGSSQLKSCCKIDQIILYLSRNTHLEKFTLRMGSHTYHRLRSSFFTLRNLTHLKLQQCSISPVASFSGFGRLTTLCFSDMRMVKETLLWFLSCCPLIKNLTMIDFRHYSMIGELSIFLDIFEFLPLLEHLEMNLYPVKKFALGGIPQKLTNEIIHLNFLSLFGISFAKGDDLSSVLCLVASSPNIKKIKLEMYVDSDREVESQNAIVLQDMSYITLDHLRELKITNFTGIKPEMKFVRVILAKSPMLEKVGLVLGKKNKDKDKHKHRSLVLQELLDFPRATNLTRIRVTW